MTSLLAHRVMLRLPRSSAGVAIPWQYLLCHRRCKNATEAFLVTVAKGNFHVFCRLQDIPGSHSQAVSANVAEGVIGKIIDAHLSALQQTPVTRSRKSYAVHECRKCLSMSGHVNPRRLMALALLLCPGEASVKHEVMLVLVPAAHEVRLGT